LRRILHTVGDGALLGGLDDRTFAILVTSVFVQITGILMLPQILGPSFSPIITPWMWVVRSVTRPFRVVNPFPSDKDVTKKTVKDTTESEQTTTNGKAAESATKKRRRRKNKTA
jgi:hypothetical protein